MELHPLQLARTRGSTPCRLRQNLWSRSSAVEREVSSPLVVAQVEAHCSGFTPIQQRPQLLLRQRPVFRRKGRSPQTSRRDVCAAAAWRDECWWDYIVVAQFFEIGLLALRECNRKYITLSSILIRPLNLMGRAQWKSSLSAKLCRAIFVAQAVELALVFGKGLLRRQPQPGQVALQLLASPKR